MKRSVELRLQDIVDYAEKATRFVDGKNAAQLAADEASYLATVYALQCVSEAARALPDEIKARAPHLPWRSIEAAATCSGTAIT